MTNGYNPEPVTPPAPRISNGFDYDLVIIGGGPAAAAAVTAVATNRLGKRVAVIDPKGTLTDAPTGAVSKVYRHCAITQGSWDHDSFWNAITSTLERAAGVHERLEAAYDRWMLDKTKMLKGCAKFVDKNTVNVVDGNGEVLETVTSDAILIASGSVAARFPFIPFDNPGFYDSDNILHLKEKPDKLVILGGSIIGCEYAQIFQRFGTEVYMVDVADRVMPVCDHDISAAMQKRMGEEGIHVHLNSSVKFDATDPLTIDIFAKDGDAKGATVKVKADAFLAATGRRGNTDNLNLECLGLQAGRDGRIPVNETSMWTGVARIYCAGDVAGENEIKPSGVYTTGQAQAIRAIYSMFINEWPRVSFRTDYFNEVATAIWTNPDVAMVGPTERQAKDRYGEAAIGVVIAKYDCTIRHAITPKDGFLKVVFLKDGGRVLGCHLYGDDANEMVHYGSSVVNSQHTVFDMIRQVMAGVTYQEVYRLAAIEGCVQVHDYMLSQKI